MSDTTQGKFDFGDPRLEEQVEAIVLDQLRALEQPSAWDLLARIEEHAGWAGRWSAEAVLTRIAQDTSLTRGAREYLRSLLLSGDLEEALRGTGAPKREVESGIDSLLRQSAAYRGSKEFQDMVTCRAICRKERFPRPSPSTLSRRWRAALRRWGEESWSPDASVATKALRRTGSSVSPELIAWNC
jgi:hypothetical protein